MSELSRMIGRRLEEITDQITDLKRRLRNAPEGRLRISRCRDFSRFYRMTEPGDKVGEYLSVKNSVEIEKLAQKDYEKKVLEMLEKERSLLMKADEYYRKQNPYMEEFYHGPEELLTRHMISARRDRVRPVECEQEEYIKKWLAEEYPQKGFAPEAPEYYTGRGIRVRSKTKWMIAEMLEKKSVPFQYEKPLALKGLGVIHPDFTVLNVRKRKTMYWEHLGMMDDALYCEKALQKIECYMMNEIFPGTELILTHETSLRPVRSQLLEEIIEVYLLS